ncbi:MULTISPECIES: hypothetical protein [Novosphingobium]|uniref:hypothetical protein n=1 Tax=Novosphingobium sp. ST904 TaxID=1684385 RepID=UPI0006C8D91E|nr:hypothetical protein [Novosphingobium sp. ST904]KPH60610.1 hypothetical protein ADT71_19170 [Novosphingobium sp. ST904]TCM39390.1 putative secreted protein with PEP-CTERM sorting signal [Novosphingobium sp. ST904]
MNTFMAIMSQLFWGVTVGALSAAFSAVAKALAALIGIGGVGWYSLRRRREKRARIDRKD